MKVVILGFYHRNNLGDELFKQVFSQCLSDHHNLTFLNPDDTQQIPKGTDVIICGGGDIMNDYFIDKIKPLVKNALNVNSKIKVYAIGVGFEYPSTISDEYLEIFDFVVTRTSEASQSKLELITPIIYTPDITTSLSLSLNFSLNFSLPHFDFGFNTKVGVFLASPVFNYVQGVEIIKAIKKKNKNYTPRLYSLNTHTQNAKECDIFLNNYIKYQIDSEDPFYKSHNPFHDGIYVDHDFNHFEVFNEFEIAVCCRFHSVILSIMTETPFVCISPTRKIQELLKTESLEYLNVKVENGNVNTEALLEKLDWVVKHKDSIKIHLRSVLRRWKSFPIQLIIKNLVNSGYTKRNFEKMSQIIKPLLKGDSKHDAKIISFFTSKSIDSEFNWGLEQQVLLPEYSLTESVKWIFKHSPENYNFLYSEYPKKFNLGYLDTNCMKGLHRSGWNYVVDNIWNLYSPNGVILDLYSDKTFGWESEFYKSIGKLPITKPWIGVFHHTQNDVYSPNNLVNCFKNELLISSLKECKGIITLSNYTAQWITQQLFYLKKFLIPVHNIPHPTELNVKKFSYDLMIHNSNRKIIQIGAWLRDTYAIYDLPDLTNFKKSVLKGKMMENYYTIPQVPVVVDHNCISRGVTQNKLIEGLQDSLIEKHSKVEIIEHLSDNDYDELLVSNIVFLKLVDSSAVNTILECIARNTPIIVNRLPATEEYLGKEYPLFYTTLTEAGRIIDNLKLIKKGTVYLSKMNKDKFTIEHFLEKLSEI